MNSMGSVGGGMAAASAYHNYMPQLSHTTGSSFPAQYCNGTTDLSHYAADPMGQVRSTGASSWYAASPDPRLASEYNTSTFDYFSFLTR